MERIKLAREFAIKVHDGQVRKVSKESYVVHPLEVGEILNEAGFNEELVMAGYLHDTVEDTDITIEIIRKVFGEKVAEYVSFNSENKDLSWEERKQHTIDTIKDASLEEKALVIADKLSNIKSLRKNIEKLGSEVVFSYFNRRKDLQKWYYKSVLKNAFYGLEVVPSFFLEFKKEVEMVFDME